MLAPSGTIIPLQLKNTIDSKPAYEGENVYCETTYPVAVENEMLVPAHSFVRGHVTEVDQPGHIVGKAQLSIKMDTLTLPDGKTWPIIAAVYSLAGTRLTSEKTDHDDGDTGGGQTFRSPGSNVSIIDSSGLAGADSFSAVSEGVGGLILELVTRGKRIVLRPGTTLEIRLTAPLDFSVPPPAPPSSTPPVLKHRPSDLAASPDKAKEQSGSQASNPCRAAQKAKSAGL